MNLLSKFAVCAIASAVILFSGCSCTGIFVEQESSSVRTESTQYNNNGNGGDFYDKVADGINVTVNVGELTPSEDGLVGILEKIRPSVVEVYATLDDGTSAGSGVIVSIDDTNEDGVDDIAIIVTCHHVIEGATGTRVKSLDGVEYIANLIGSDPNSDIGVICIKADEDKTLDGLTYASWMSNSDDLKVGTEVVAIGNPLGYLGGTVTQGMVSSINRDVSIDGKTMTLIQTDASINSGNSGGGLFDATTVALVGIVNAGYASYAAQGLNFAIPSNVALNIENQLLSTYGDTFGYIKDYYDFGVSFGLAYESYGFNRRYYVAINSLDVYGTFAKGGMMLGDLIYSIKIGEMIYEVNNINSGTVSQITEFLNEIDCKVGDEIEVSYGRNVLGSYQTYTITFPVAQYIYGS